MPRPSQPDPAGVGVGAERSRHIESGSPERSTRNPAPGSTGSPPYCPVPRTANVIGVTRGIQPPRNPQDRSTTMNRTGKPDPPPTARQSPSQTPICAAVARCRDDGAGGVPSRRGSGGRADSTLSGRGDRRSAGGARRAGRGRCPGRDPVRPARRPHHPAGQRGGRPGRGPPDAGHRPVPRGQSDEELHRDGRAPACAGGPHRPRRRGGQTCCRA